MQTFAGERIRLIRDRDLLIVRSQTQREIFVKAPVALPNGKRTHTVLEPFKIAVCTGKTFKQAGLEKDQSRSDVDVTCINGVILAEDTLSKVKGGALVLITSDEAASMLDLSLASQKTAEELAAEAEAAAKIANAEKNAEKNAELEKAVADREKFERDAATQSGAPDMQLSEVVALQQEQNPEPVTEPVAEPVVEVPVAEEAPIVPAVELKVVKEPEPELKAEESKQDRKKNRPKKRD